MTAGSIDRALALLGELLAGAALVVEGDDACGRPGQVGDDEPDARIKPTRMPLDLGHHAARLAPPLRPIAEAGEGTAHFMRRSSNRTLEQISDPVLQDRVGWKPNCVADALGFRELVYPGIGQSRIASEIKTLASYHRLQRRAPAAGTVHAARS